MLVLTVSAVVSIVNKAIACKKVIWKCQMFWSLILEGFSCVSSYTMYSYGRNIAHIYIVVLCCRVCYSSIFLISIYFLSAVRSSVLLVSLKQIKSIRNRPCWNNKLSFMKIMTCGPDWPSGRRSNKTCLVLTTLNSLRIRCTFTDSLNSYGRRVVARARAITTTTLKSKQNSLSFSSVDSIDFVCSGGVTQSNRIGCSLLLLQLLTFNRRLFAYSEKRAASTR